jgi:hypothetical protein
VFNFTINFTSSRFYTVVAPNKVRENSRYHLSLATIGLNDPIEMKITLKDSHSQFQEKQVTVMPNAPQVAYLDVSNIILTNFKPNRWPIPINLNNQFFSFKDRQMGQWR